MKSFSDRFISHACLAVAAMALLSCGGGGGDSGVTTNTSTTSSSIQAAERELGDAFAASLSGPQETPPTISVALGSGTLVLNASTREMTAIVTTNGITGTAAHIHLGPPGTAGPIVFPLSESITGSGIWTTHATLTDEQVNTLRSGNYYFNVHSAAFPNGEIRGQILSEDPNANRTASVNTSATSNMSNTAGVPAALPSVSNFLSALRGSQEVPPNASSAQGSGTIVIDPNTRQMIAALTTTGIAGIAAHIHQGAPGIAGPIVVSLVSAGPGSPVWLARATLTADQANALRDGNLYFNVHSAAYPDGEIRGQIVPQQHFIGNLIQASNTGDLSSLANPLNIGGLGTSGSSALTPSSFGPTGSTTGTISIPGGMPGTGTGTSTGTNTGMSTGMNTGAGIGF